MQQIKRVEKRLPFGFRGEWGNVYKAFPYEESEFNVIQYQNANYVEIKDLVQFKSLQNGSSLIPASIAAYLNTSSATNVIETTDSFFNDKKKSFECIVSNGDIVKLNSNFWLVCKIDEKCIYTPNKQSFYYLAIKSIEVDGGE